MNIVLLDSHALIHRAYHALPDFATSAGEPTGAIYGLSATLLKIIGDFHPDYIIACYDRPEKTHRHDSYTDYKGTRVKLDDALITQLETSKEIFKALNIPLYEKAGFEADDMLGTIVEQLADNKDAHVIIASGDMDTLQLVHGTKVKVFTLKKGIKDTVVYDEHGVKERFGFGPELIPDYKGLRGDPSDNIPGIKGIGEKTATTLITTFGSIEEIYKALKKDKEAFKKVGITDRIIGLLEEGEEDAQFSKMLATIRRDAPITFELPEKTFKDGVKMENVEALFKRFEFRTLSMKFRETIEHKPGTKIAKVAKPAKKVGSLSYEEEHLVTLEKSEENNSGEEDDVPLPKEIGLLVSVVDSSVADPTARDLREVSGETDQDAAVKVLKERIKKEGLQQICDIEMGLIPVIDKMEKRGVKIDIKHLNELSKTYHKTLEGLEKKIYEYAGAEFNINSPKQLGEVLFDKLNLTAKGMKKTAGGARSTKESELLKLKDSHPIINLILEYRELAKLLSTYIDSIPKLVDEHDRLHTRFLQVGAATGRMSSLNPNLQNIPIKTELGRAIRDAFIPEMGMAFASFDYSQFELRIAAFLSGDENLINIFKEGHDVHSAVSSQVFGVPLSEVTSDMRRKAKVINFGILYGMGVNALRANLGSTKEEAQTFLDDYFKTYATLAEYLEQVKSFAKEYGYTTTFLGRRRYFPDIKSKLPFMRASAERMAINAPIQGTLADLTKVAMIKVDEYVKREKLEDKVHLLIQVHDELDYEIDEGVKDTVIPKIKEIMESVLTLQETRGVPIVVNAEAGESWGQTEEVM